MNADQEAAEKTSGRAAGILLSRTGTTQRRRTLWLATYGIDVGPRRIHGVEVAA
ncbi:hypothetical protein GCM10023083_76920 [Streptomyces phyllanthi]